MKKNLTYLFAVLCVVSFFTACSKDDESGSSGGWKGLSGTYDNAKTLALKMGEVTIPVGGKSVTIDATSEEKASVTLHNVIPESNTVVIDADLKKVDGVFTLTGSATVGECGVFINGTVKDGIASILYQRELSSPVVGTWNLKAGAGTIYMNVVTGNAMIDNKLPGMVGPAVSGLIWSKVSAVTVYLPKNGVFSVNWRKQGDSEDTNLGAVMAMFGIQYCVVDGKFVLAIDKNYIDTIVGLAGPKLEEMGIPVEALMKMLVDLGGYYGLPINMKQDGNEVKMYVDKSMVVPVITMAAPIIKPMIPSDYQMFLDLGLQLLPNAKALDFGLVLTK